MKKENQKAKLFVRRACLDDIDGIMGLIEKVYSDMPPYPKDMIKGQITNYPEGHFVAIYDEDIVGYCASIRISGDKALKSHTWIEITGGGFGSTHNPGGDYLYGYEICVDPTRRGLHIGQRLYNERKKLCKFLRLKGIVFAGRLPSLKKRIKQVKTVENYISLIKKKKIRDPVLSFQIRNGFEIIGIMKSYLPYDLDSMGYAAHMLWKNPEYSDSTQIGASHTPKYMQSVVRVAAVQYSQRKIRSFEEFEEIVTYFIDVVSDYKTDFVLFPEFFTFQLLSIENEPIKPHEAILKLTTYTNVLNSFFQSLAIKYNVNIIAGSHPEVITKDILYNTSYIYLRDGSIHKQSKVHPTPNESYWWNVQGSNEVTVIQTDCGPIGVLICYDCEFPELARHLVNQGVNILFVPFLTDEKQSYCRVRYCAQARAVENQTFVVLAGSVGNLPRVHNMDIHYAQSCILTPCDFQFSRDGIAADTTPNVEMIAFADLRMENLFEARSTGTVRNLKDRRHDLYRVKWYPKKEV